MRRNGYLWTSHVNLDTAVRFADPDFLLASKISAIWRRFTIIIAYYILNVRIFLLPDCLTYWPSKNTTRVDPHVDNSHQDWSPYADPFLSYEWWRWKLKIEHWKCVRGHCACAESRDPWVGGQKQLHIWNPRQRFAYSLYNFYWVTTTIKGRFLSSVTNDKALDCVNFLCVTLWPFDLEQFRTWRVTWPTMPPNLKILRLFIHELRVITFPIDYKWKCVRGYCACDESRDPWVWGKKHLLKPFSGVKNSNSRRNVAKNGGFGGKWESIPLVLVSRPAKALPSRNRIVWRILRQNRCTRLGCSLSQKKSSRVTLGARNHACAEQKPLNRFC